MTPQTLGGIIAGRIIPNAGQRARLAAALGVPEADLFPTPQND
jgi:hypothetical protein